MENREITLLIFKSFNQRDFSDIQPVMHENIRFDFPGVGEIIGAARVVVFLKMLLRKYPVLRFEVKDIILEGNKAVAIWTNSGEKVNGDLYENSGATLVHFDSGKIVFLSDYFKSTSFVSEK